MSFSGSFNPKLQTLGNVFRLKGSIQRIALLDCTGSLMSLPYSSKTWSKSTVDREPHYVVMVSEKQARVVTLPGQVCAFKATMSDTSFVVRADVIQIKTTGRLEYLCRRETYSSHVKLMVTFDLFCPPVFRGFSLEGVCLAVYLATGNIVAYSLPSLKPLIDIDFLPLVDVRLVFVGNVHVRV